MRAMSAPSAASSGRSRVVAAAIALVVLSFTLVAATPAAAHGERIASSPAPGEVVGKVTHIDLVFSTAVHDWTLTVEKPDSSMLDGQAIQKANPYLSFETAPLTDEGQYIVRYSGIDEDNDVVEGAYAFTYEIGAPNPAPLGVDFSALNRDEGWGWWIYALMMAGVVAIAVLAGLLAEKMRRLRAIAA